MVDLLVEPDMPKLDMKVEGNQDAVVFVNGKSFADASGNQKLENLPLEKGWNPILIILKNRRAKETGEPRSGLNQIKKSL